MNEQPPSLRVNGYGQYVSVCMRDMGDEYRNVFFPRELYRELTGPALPKD